MPPIAAAAVASAAASAAAAPAADTPAEDISDSGTAVLAIPALVVRICTALDAGADGANLRLACKQTASSLDGFDLMWCARQDIPKVHTAMKQHASITVPVDRIKRTITGSLGDVWSCPPLLKWVVLQAAKQGDAELLGTVLGRKQQSRESKQQQQPKQPSQAQLQQAEQPQPQQQQQQAGTSALCGDTVVRDALQRNALEIVLGELGFSAGLTKEWPGGGHSDVCVWLTAVAAEEAVHSNICYTNPRMETTQQSTG